MVQGQETSDIPHDDDSCNSELEVESIKSFLRNDHTSVLSKKGKSLFEDFLTHDRLVRAIRRTKITPADLSTSVLINIGCRSRASVNLSYAYIARHYHNITIKNSSTIYQKWTALKKFWCIRTTKLVKNWMVV